MGLFHPQGSSSHLRAERYRVDPSDPALLAYLQASLDRHDGEELHVIYCDRGRRYLFDEACVSGGADHLVARIRPLFERALALGASGLLLAHNHPSGNCQPSAHDIRSTRMLRDLGCALEIDLIDHLIFAGGRCLSMTKEGYL